MCPQLILTGWEWAWGQGYQYYSLNFSMGVCHNLGRFHSYTNLALFAHKMEVTIKPSMRYYVLILKVGGLQAASTHSKIL